MPVQLRRQKRNKVDSIVDRLGRKCETQEEVELAFVDYFQDIFTSSQPHNIDACTDAIKGRLTSSLKDGLTATFTEEEIYSALMQMAPLKAPGRMDSRLIFINKIGARLEWRYVKLSFIF
jgi:hypothetical protein